MLSSELVQAIVLGIVQGVAEFLPISSSGHLVILQEPLEQWLGLQTGGSERLALNVALHFGTLMSILVVYRADILRLLRDPLSALPIVIATVPIVIVGFTMKDWVEDHLQRPVVAGCGLLVTAALLLAGRKFEREQGADAKVTLFAAAVIGLFQAAALVPGISRSGSTIAGGLLSGLRRDSSATFSFLIAIPAILGASVLTAAEAWSRPESTSSLSASALCVGMVVSFAVGLLALQGLLRLISRRRLHWFAAYCALLGASTIVWQLTR